MDYQPPPFGFGMRLRFVFEYEEPDEKHFPRWKDELRQITRSTFTGTPWEGFDVEVELRRGSLDLWLWLTSGAGAVGSVLAFVRSYPNLKKGWTELRKDLSEAWDKVESRVASYIHNQYAGKVDRKNKNLRGQVDELYSKHLVGEISLPELVVGCCRISREYERWKQQQEIREKEKTEQQILEYLKFLEIEAQATKLESKESANWSELEQRMVELLEATSAETTHLERQVKHHP